MSGYLSYFKTQLITGLQYKQAALAGLSTQFFWGILNVMVYQAFYAHTSIDNINFSELICYVWLNQAFFALIYIRVKDSEIKNSIKNGLVAYELCRPYNLYNWWFIKFLANKYASVTLRFLPVIIFSFLLPRPYGLLLPNSLLSFILFLISLVLGSIVLVSIALIVHSIGFFNNQSEGISTIIYTVAELLAGFALPLPLLPNIIQKVSEYLPFRLIGDLPFRIYSGNINISYALQSIGMQLVWIVILVIIGKLIMKKALTKVCIQGG